MSKTVVFCSLLTVFLFFGCKKDKEEDRLEIRETALDFTASAGSATVDVFSNIAWTAESNQSWCDVSPKSGQGDGKISVTVQQNSNTTPRAAKITVKATVGELNREITVTQEAGDPDPDSPGDEPLYIDPFLDFGASATKTAVKHYENGKRVLIGEDDDFLVYSGENSNVNEVFYGFENTSLSFVNIWFETTPNIYTRAFDYLSSKYKYFGNDSDGDIFFYEEENLIILLYENDGWNIFFQKFESTATQLYIDPYLNFGASATKMSVKNYENGKRVLFKEDDDNLIYFGENEDVYSVWYSFEKSILFYVNIWLASTPNIDTRAFNYLSGKYEYAGKNESGDYVFISENENIVIFLYEEEDGWNIDFQALETTTSSLLYIDPYLNFGASATKTAVKNYENGIRDLSGENSNALLYYGENDDVWGVGYSFENSVLSFVMVWLDGSAPDIYARAFDHLSSKYEYLGKDGNGDDIFFNENLKIWLYEDDDGDWAIQFQALAQSGTSSLKSSSWSKNESGIIKPVKSSSPAKTAPVRKRQGNTIKNRVPLTINHQ